MTNIIAISHQADQQAFFLSTLSLGSSMSLASNCSNLISEFLQCWEALSVRISILKLALLTSFSQSASSSAVMFSPLRFRLAYQIFRHKSEGTYISIFKFPLFFLEPSLDDFSPGEQSLLEVSECFILNINSCFFIQLGVLEVQLLQDRQQVVLLLFFFCIFLILFLALLHLIAGFLVNRLF